MCLPIVIIPILKLTSSAEIMTCAFKTRLWGECLSWLISIIVMGFNMYLSTLYLGDYAWIRIIYIGFVAYLASTPLQVSPTSNADVKVGDTQLPSSVWTQAENSSKFLLSSSSFTVFVVLSCYPCQFIISPAFQIAEYFQTPFAFIYIYIYMPITLTYTLPLAWNVTE